MHKARHTAGQNMLDATGNLKAVQKLLGHRSMLTTADVYLDWDVDQLAASLADMLEEPERIVPAITSANPHRKAVSRWRWTAEAPRQRAPH